MIQVVEKSSNAERRWIEKELQRKKTERTVRRKIELQKKT